MGHLLRPRDREDGGRRHVRWPPGSVGAGPDTLPGSTSPGGRPLTSAQTLLTEHGAELGSLAYVVLQNQADAERVVIDALADAIRRPGLLAQRDERHALLVITTRHLLAAARRGGNVDPMLPARLPSDLSDREAELDRLALKVGMSALPVRQRVMIALQHVTELSVDEIAAVMRDERSWAQSELAAARKALLHSMERRESPLLEVTEIIDEP
jgi:DNA-directed RNA polymerase specialized sigma24 family protein